MHQEPARSTHHDRHNRIAWLFPIVALLAIAAYAACTDDDEVDVEFVLSILSPTITPEPGEDTALVGAMCRHPDDIDTIQLTVDTPGANIDDYFVVITPEAYVSGGPVATVVDDSGPYVFELDGEADGETTFGFEFQFNAASTQWPTDVEFTATFDAEHAVSRTVPADPGASDYYLFVDGYTAPAGDAALFEAQCGYPDGTSAVTLEVSSPDGPLDERFLYWDSIPLSTADVINVIDDGDPYLVGFDADPSDGESEVGFVFAFDPAGTGNFPTDLEFTARFDGEYPTSRILSTAPDFCIPDGFFDLVDSILSNMVTFNANWIDIICQDSDTISRPQSRIATDYGAGGPYECGRSGSGVRVVCSDDVEDMPPGEVVLVSANHLADIPDADGGHSYIYSVVFDSDGSSTNNWVPQGPYDGDYFQGADRWYECVYDHGYGTWEVRVTQVDDSQNLTPVTGSTARAVIEGGTITWHIARSELPGAAPTWRVTAFGHDGIYSPSDRGGDVTGVDATDPLLPLE